MLALYRQGRVPRLGLHGPRPGGGRRGRGPRARPRRRRRAAQPRARLPLRARRDHRRRVPQLLRQGRRAPRSGATATCISAPPQAASSRSSRCSATSCPSSPGAALAFKRRGEPRVAMTFLGEGAFSVGDTHEGLNLAAVWQVPVVFVIQSNRYSYSTPVARQMVNTNIAQRIYGGWSIPAERVDGTDALAVLDTVRAAVERARNGNGPQAVEALSVRMHGHAAHDDARYVPAGMREEFADALRPGRAGSRRGSRSTASAATRSTRCARRPPPRSPRVSPRPRTRRRPTRPRSRTASTRRRRSLARRRSARQQAAEQQARSATSRERIGPNRVPAAGGGRCGRRR